MGTGAAGVYLWARVQLSSEEVRVGAPGGETSRVWYLLAFLSFCLPHYYQKD